ncbi:hypothetical protein pETSU_165 [Edwardsiella phage pEt-SU]|uniref:Uncharacterized protein n=1 Tax=Edwardsiella phage pEt-SU TaxID=2562142 RepID=A0A4D6DY65_9CAUD|nr:hypothetical protein HOV39_gp165 [Edwardsiella phage pEt-SU]QBZ70746.1 hypothetical protein pETSU_165 [Edwardsiella phage pEt-SU]
MVLLKGIIKVFKIPDELVTKVKVGEKFYISSVGNGKAKLCGNQFCMEVPGDQVKLGECFYATATNRLVKRLGLTDVITPVPDKPTQLLYKGKRVA